MVSVGNDWLLAFVSDSLFFFCKAVETTELTMASHPLFVYTEYLDILLMVHRLDAMSWYVKSDGYVMTNGTLYKLIEIYEGNERQV